MSAKKKGDAAVPDAPVAPAEPDSPVTAIPGADLDLEVDLGRMRIPAPTSATQRLARAYAAWLVSERLNQPTLLALCTRYVEELEFSSRSSVRKYDRSSPAEELNGYAELFQRFKSAGHDMLEAGDVSVQRLDIEERLKTVTHG